MKRLLLVLLLGSFATVQGCGGAQVENQEGSESGTFGAGGPMGSTEGGISAIPSIPGLGMRYQYHASTKSGAPETEHAAILLSEAGADFLLDHGCKLTDGIDKLRYSMKPYLPSSTGETQYLLAALVDPHARTWIDCDDQGAFPVPESQTYTTGTVNVVVDVTFVPPGEFLVTLSIDRIDLYQGVFALNFTDAKDDGLPLISYPSVVGMIDLGVLPPGIPPSIPDVSKWITREIRMGSLTSGELQEIWIESIVFALPANDKATTNTTISP